MTSANPSRSRMSPSELGTWVAMASFGMLFGTFLLSYLLARVRFPVWPPIGADPVPLGIPTLSTGVLVLSSFFVYKANQSFPSTPQSFFKNWNFSLALGLLFLVLQGGLWIQLWNQGLRAQDHIFGGTVYVLTGLHALHVLVALGGLVFVPLKLKPLLKTRGLEIFSKSEAPKNMGLFWHFLGVVWILMYLLLVLF
jgi:cytochrome c oxidase subunit 3